MNLDQRLSQIVRDAVETMLAERFDRLEERLAESVAAVVQRQPEERQPLLTLNKVARQLGVAPRTVQRLVSTGEFPTPIPISPGRSRWRQEDVDAWLEARR